MLAAQRTRWHTAAELDALWEAIEAHLLTGAVAKYGLFDLLDVDDACQCPCGVTAPAATDSRPQDGVDALRAGDSLGGPDRPRRCRMRFVGEPCASVSAKRRLINLVCRQPP